MLLRMTTLHQPNKQQRGTDLTIMAPSLPCSFIIERCESHDRVYSSMTERAMISTPVIAKSDSYEGFDLHILE